MGLLLAPESETLWTRTTLCIRSQLCHALGYRSVAPYKSHTPCVAQAPPGTMEIASASFPVARLPTWLHIITHLGIWYHLACWPHPKTSQLRALRAVNLRSHQIPLRKLQVRGFCKGPRMLGPHTQKTHAVLVEVPTLALLSTHVFLFY